MLPTCTCMLSLIFAKIKTTVMLSSHQRRFDGALKRRAKRHQSVAKLDLSSRVVIDHGKAWSKGGHSARAPNFFELLKNFGRSVTNWLKRQERIKA